MCRWLFKTPVRNRKSLPSIRQLIELFYALRSQQGGQGDGVFCPSWTEFGVDFPFYAEQPSYSWTRVLARALTSNLAAPFLWHTRIASSGGVSQELLHPHIGGRTCDGTPTIILAHNGTEYAGSIIADYLTAYGQGGRRWSDTSVVASMLYHSWVQIPKSKFLAEGANPDPWKELPFRLTPSSGIWVYGTLVNNYHVWRIRVESGDCMYSPATGIWASWLPRSVFPDAYSVAKGCYLLGKSHVSEESVSWSQEIPERATTTLADLYHGRVLRSSSLTTSSKPSKPTSTLNCDRGVRWADDDDDNQPRTYIGY